MVRRNAKRKHLSHDLLRKTSFAQALPCKLGASGGMIYLAFETLGINPILIFIRVERANG